MSTESGTECRAITEQPTEPLWLLLYWLWLALVARVRSRIPMRIVTSGISLCGLILLFMPLALWMASSTRALGLILLTGAVAGLLILFLLWLSPEDRF